MFFAELLQISSLRDLEKVPKLRQKNSSLSLILQFTIWAARSRTITPTGGVSWLMSWTLQLFGWSTPLPSAKDIFLPERHSRLYVEEKGKIYIRIKDVVKVGVLAEKQMEDVENCQMSSSSSSPCPFGECEISVLRLLPKLWSSNPSFRARISASRLQSQPQRLNPNLVAQISASMLKSQPAGLNPRYVGQSVSRKLP